ncbi:GspH/FimT family pseudopilin [Luteolibacter marinus]|uniref:GspH/FimT family pseudopilin n=1 Tax=Luteolibacter marinus TaxID=2776705 RepID=UPI001868E737
MNSPAPHRQPAGFSLIELMMVMVIAGILLTIGFSVFGRSAVTARRTATDEFAAAVEQARTSAITRRKNVVLAVAPPVAGSSDQICRFGLFEVDDLPDGEGNLTGRQVQRWNSMPQNVILLDGKIEGLRNVMDEDAVQLTWKDGKNHAQVHPLVFSPRGGLVWPTGSDPVAVKIGTGNYRDGQPREVSGGGHNSMRIGRVVARPWRLD